MRALFHRALEWFLFVVDPQVVKQIVPLHKLLAAVAAILLEVANESLRLPVGLRVLN